jgi:hypothetical protein
MESNNILPFTIPVLEIFSSDDEWDIDTLRLGSDGLFYFRAARRREAQAEIHMFRTADLSSNEQAGQEITIEVFYNSAPRKEGISHPSLPPLPEGFVYTGIGTVGDSLFASWEEQADFSIGAAGFVAIKR